MSLDVGAREKQGNPKVDDGFKVPKEKITCIAASVDVDEGFESSGVEETRSTVTNGSRSHTNRRYRDKTASVPTNSESGVTLDRGGSDDTFGTPRSREHRSSDVPASPSRSSRTVSSRSLRYEREDHGVERRLSSDDSRNEHRNARKRHYYDDRRDTHGRYGEDYRRSRNRYESRTPGM